MPDSEKDEAELVKQLADGDEVTKHGTEAKDQTKNPVPGSPS